jgi:uncharacterized protein (TIGR00725 family)
MQHRRIIIGAIGGDRQRDAARAFGRAVAQAGCILLTGGRLQDSDEVKDAAMKGAVSIEAESSLARLVGILPTSGIEWDDSRAPKWDESRARSLFLETGLKHTVRNVINGLTPDALVVFGGSQGTLAEAAFAGVAGKPLFLTNSSTEVQRLRDNFNKYFALDDGPDGPVNEYLCLPVHAYRHAWGRPPPSTIELKAKLIEFLATDPDLEKGPAELVALCIAAVPSTATSGETGFPGLPSDPDAKARFEKIIVQLSQ